MFNLCKADADRVSASPGGGASNGDAEETALLMDVAAIQPAMMDLWFPQYADEGIGSRCGPQSNLPLGAPVAGGCRRGVGNGGSDAVQGTFTRALVREACPLNPPFNPHRVTRVGDCFWIPDRGWNYMPKRRGVGARRRARPQRQRSCYSKMTHKGLWVCCQGVCRLAVRLSR